MCASCLNDQITTSTIDFPEGGWKPKEGVGGGGLGGVLRVLQIGDFWQISIYEPEQKSRKSAPPPPPPPPVQILALLPDSGTSTALQLKSLLN